jgi:hypothetical protein
VSQHNPILVTLIEKHEEYERSHKVASAATYCVDGQGHAMIYWDPGAKLLFGPPPKFLKIILLNLFKNVLVHQSIIF